MKKSVALRDEKFSAQKNPRSIEWGFFVCLTRDEEITVIETSERANCSVAFKATGEIFLFVEVAAVTSQGIKFLVKIFAGAIRIV